MPNSLEGTRDETNHANRVQPPDHKGASDASGRGMSGIYLSMTSCISTKVILTLETSIKHMAILSKEKLLNGHVTRSSFSLVMAISRNGVLFHIIKDTRKEGINSTFFQRFLCDLTISLPFGAILVMDNARIHHTQEIKETMMPLVYLPPYSPDYNPIELVFGWIKRWTKTKERVTDIQGVINEAICNISVDIINAFIDHCMSNWKSDAL